jgi:archaellum biogenesis ATPase FlaH
VLIDGFESLVMYNDFRRALQAVEHIKDTALTHNSRLVLAVDKRTLDPKEVALLEKNSVIIAG